MKTILVVYTNVKLTNKEIADNKLTKYAFRTSEDVEVGDLIESKKLESTRILQNQGKVIGQDGVFVGKRPRFRAASSSLDIRNNSSPNGNRRSPNFTHEKREPSTLWNKRHSFRCKKS